MDGVKANADPKRERRQIDDSFMMVNLFPKGYAGVLLICQHWKIIVVRTYVNTYF